MNIYKLFHGRALWKKNPTFGPRIYIGGHRYVYYIDGRPRYYFSDRPYALEDAKKWKSRNLIFSLIMLAIVVWILVDSPIYESDQLMVLANLVCIVVGVLSAILLIVFLTIDPKKDPMLVSFPCTSDLERPQEDTCQNCSGVYSRGAHTVCPHCNAPIAQL